MAARVWTGGVGSLWGASASIVGVWPRGRRMTRASDMSGRPESEHDGLAAIDGWDDLIEVASHLEDDVEGSSLEFDAERTWLASETTGTPHEGVKEIPDARVTEAVEPPRPCADQPRGRQRHGEVHG